MPRACTCFRLALTAQLLLAGCTSGLVGRPVPETSSSHTLAARIADAMLAAGNAPAALHVTDGMLAADSADVGAHLRRGRALTLLGRYREAADEFDNVAKQRPDDVPTLEALAASRSAEGDSGAAERAWRRVLQHKADDPHDLIALGVTLDLQERHDEAQALYKQVLSARPDDSAAATNLGLSLALSGHPTESLAFLRRPGVLAQGKKAEHDLVVALVLAGEETRARSMLGEEMGEADVVAAILSIKELVKG